MFLCTSYIDNIVKNYLVFWNPALNLIIYFINLFTTFLPFITFSCQCALHHNSLYFLYFGVIVVVQTNHHVYFIIIIATSCGTALLCIPLFPVLTMAIYSCPLFFLLTLSHNLPIIVLPLKQTTKHYTKCWHGIPPKIHKWRFEFEFLHPSQSYHQLLLESVHWSHTLLFV